jgi:hypothetical protein
MAGCIVDIRSISCRDRQYFQCPVQPAWRVKGAPSNISHKVLEILPPPPPGGSSGLCMRFSPYASKAICVRNYPCTPLTVLHVYLSWPNWVAAVANYWETLWTYDRFCGLVVKLPGCRPRGPGFYFRRCQIFRVAVGLERVPPKPCEDKWRATWKKNCGSGLQNWD